MKNKKIYTILIIFLFILFNSIFVKSLDTNTSEQKAISCLKSKVSGKCNTLTTEEKIFSLLSIGECKNELKAESADGTCWPSSSCNTKITAEAIIALKNSGESTIKAEDWLMQQKILYKSLNWYLQVESENKSKCTVEYDSEKHEFEVSEEQVLSSRGLGSCLYVSDSYWLRIAPSCLDKEFSVSCDTPFSTSLLFKKLDSNYFFVLLNSHFAQSEGKTVEKPKSYCIAEQGTSSCSYEATLWSAFALNFVGRNSSSDYLAYLISSYDQNQRYLPEAILQILTNNYKDVLINKQTNEGYWQGSNDKFYDTAIALLPFQNDDNSQQKIKAKNWLEQVQQSDGCWRGDIKDTGFLVYSLWSKKVTPVPSTDCRNAGYYCLTNDAMCRESSGNVLSGYNCGNGICCDKQEVQKNCYQQSGVLCLENQTCSGRIITSYDSTSSQKCCVGTCTNQSGYPVDEESLCEKNNGLCKEECSKGEEQISPSCDNDEEVCCIEKEKSSLLWVFLLGILILLVIFGFIFRKKLKVFLSPILSKLWKKKDKETLINPNKSSQQMNKNIPLRGQNVPSMRVYPGAVPRRVIIPQNKQNDKQLQGMRREGDDKSQKEVEDILKKLKDISK